MIENIFTSTKLFTVFLAYSLISGCALYNQTTENAKPFLYENIDSDKGEKPKSNNRSSICYDGKDILSFYYQGSGTFDVITKNLDKRKHIKDEFINDAICKAVGSYCSPGGSTVVNNVLWISDAYGSRLTALNLKTFTMLEQFKFSFEGSGSKSIGGVAHDGEHIWLAVHIFDYSKLKSKTQLLVKIDPATGEELDRFPLPESNSRDGTNALTWNGEDLLYLKSKTLYHISNITGGILYQKPITNVDRVGGITWVDDYLVIQSFDGEIIKYKE